MTDKLIELFKKIKPKTDEEMAEYENQRNLIRDGVQELKQEIIKESDQPVQKEFSFMPTSMTRTSPFFPINKRYMKDRPYEELEFETSWGKICFSGKRLCIYDETVLLAILKLVNRYRLETFLTTQHEICDLMNVKPCTQTYNAIWQSIRRLTSTTVDLYKYTSKSKKNLKGMMVNTILSGGQRDDANNKIKITVNPYFMDMYLESFITYIDYDFRLEIKGDVAKALYRFLRGQRDSTCTYHVLTLAKAINLDTNLPLKRIRERLRLACKELIARKFISKYTINKNDTLTVWKIQKPTLKLT